MTTMTPLKARVKNGRLVLDERTDLPEGDEIALVPLDQGSVEPGRPWPPELVTMLLAPPDRELSATVDAMQVAIDHARRSRRLPTRP
jgi:hypothetical protein